MMSRYLAFIEGLDLLANLRTPHVVEPLLVQAFFDESGKFMDSGGVFVFGGFVALRNTLLTLTQEWAERLGQDRIPNTSMKEALARSGPFANLSIESRDSLLLDLATVVSKSRPGMLIVYSPLDMVTREAFSALTAEQKKRLGGNPYYGAFEGCILAALSVRGDIHLQVTCDIAEEYSEKCIAAFNKMRQHNADAKQRCVGLCFTDDTWMPALQIADMIAYCERAKVLESVSHYKIPEITRRLIEILDVSDRRHDVAKYRVYGNLASSGLES